MRAFVVGVALRVSCVIGVVVAVPLWLLLALLSPPRLARAFQVTGARLAHRVEEVG